VHCIGKVVLKNKFNFTSAVIRSIDLLVFELHCKRVSLYYTTHFGTLDLKNFVCVLLTCCLKSVLIFVLFEMKIFIHRNIS